ncbi:PREDICTED: acyl-CoA-binding domain-containing protein 3-like [Nelumbo nucifera]|uniref:Acyl-CoA-binding domain-containing protein 3-like n=2 Tax=Nelumbo nucifera TaxID=4432 RepID=A0A1U8QAI9_NELNU|nr:PREDICTED: acyl-CoA-binding domain-containing protein 3-like [Nelumbo nucifera]XP_010272005.1 PREDICTED: acyl-CoA-binding domain-containing protein 3-like [Nelumbo nucifera]XP_010272014.1 PREDICTED: acyl-CoA-binding domain-containing protein 3-like [Nelumbo nucifera]XP_010272022.1 PREDICTED: acyl-CoA-binding domain-containing protein 3-like [Nelumbo nucifera]XP_019055101.1 PREDICTED: acyl-CoA-binding domain-containing protein 3-like [Nelumbo nucifera]DAD41453.1 TPA_asm: hypothetical protein
MELLLELFFTGFLSLIFTFVVAKLVSVASAGDLEERESMLRSKREFDGEMVTEERSFEGQLINRVLETKEIVEFFGEAAMVVEYEGQLVQEKLEMVHRVNELEKESREKVEIFEDDRLRTKEETSEENEIKVLGILKEKFIEERPYKEEVITHVSDSVHAKEETSEEDEIKVIGILEEKFIEERPDKEVVSCASDSGHAKEETTPTEDDRLEDDLVEESLEKAEVREINIELVEGDNILAKVEKDGIDKHEPYQKNVTEGAEGGQNDDEVLFSDEDDWEGIERTEVEKLFGAAVAFLSSGNNNDHLSKVDSDIQMQLYGLHKVATEGPCHEPQPMALKVSARAKWNAWQQLGNMTPEVAMEQYITLLSDMVPGWMEESAGGGSKKESFEGGAPDLGTFLHHESGSEDESEPEEPQYYIEGGNGSGGKLCK